MKSPAFQFYVQDFLTGTMSFTAEEVGGYMLLLCRQWDKGFIEETELEGVSRLRKDQLKNVLSKFKKSKSRYTNKRLELVREEKVKYAEMQSSKGKEGAKKRWQRPSSGDAPAMNLPMAKNSSSSSSSTSKENLTKEDWELQQGMLKASGDWVFKICRDRNLPLKTVDLMIDQFLKELDLKEDYKPLKELKKYFINWLPIHMNEHTPKRKEAVV